MHVCIPRAISGLCSVQTAVINSMGASYAIHCVVDTRSTIIVIYLDHI